MRDERRGMMKRQTLAAGGLAVTMALALSACVGQTKEETKAEAAAATATEQAAAGKGTAGGETKDVFPLSDSVTVTIAGARDDSETPLGDRQFFKDMEEKTNLKVDWIDWPQSQVVEKRNLAFAGGELPDAMMGNFILDTASLVKYGAEGWLMTWNDYINEEYMPNFYALCQRAPGLLESITAADGNIYGLPQFDYSITDVTNDTLIINTEWLEKVGMDMPTTTEEFYQVLKAFKEAGDLNGNGKADEIPFTFRYNDGNNGQLSFMGFTGLAYNNQHERICYKDGQIVYVPQQEEYKEFLTYMNKLYSEGLVDPEVFTMTQAAYNAKVKTSEPTCGVISIWSAAGVNAPIPGNDPEKEGVYQYVLPLSGDNGVDPVWIPRYTPYNRSFCFVVSADTKYAEELVRWADLHYDLDTSIQNSKGLIGTYIQEVGDRVYEELKKEDGSAYTSAEKSEFVTLDDGMYGIAAGDCTIKQEVTPGSKAAANELYKKYLNPNHAYTYALMSEEEAKQDSILKQPLKDYVDQRTADFITNGNIDARWDEYLSGLDKLDVDKFVEMYSEIASRSKVN